MLYFSTKKSLPNNLFKKNITHIYNPCLKIKGGVSSQQGATLDIVGSGGLGSTVGINFDTFDRVY